MQVFQALSFVIVSGIVRPVLVHFGLHLTSTSQTVGGLITSSIPVLDRTNREHLVLSRVLVRRSLRENQEKNTNVI